VETAPSLSFTSLASSAASSVFGQAVTFTATVVPDLPGSPAPTGSVHFVDTTTGTDLGTFTLSGGTASVSTSALAAGKNVIAATYRGDGNYLPSAGTLTQPVAQVLTVNTTADTSAVNPMRGAQDSNGNISLRSAIQALNAAANGTAANPDLIQFNIPTTDPGYNSTTGTFTIQPLSILPTISDTLVLNGYTQPGSSPNTNSVATNGQSSDNAVRRITLDGSAGGGSFDGLVIAAGNSTVRGFTIQNFNDDIHLETRGNDVIAGNYISWNQFTTTGDTGMGEGGGVFVDGVSNNTIGGTVAAARNLVVDDTTGISIHGSGATGNLVAGNYIGTDGINQLNSASSYAGVIVDASNNTISGNVVASDPWGIVISNDYGISSGSSDDNLVQGNYVGTNPFGTAPLTDATGGRTGGGSLIGVYIPGVASGNTIGGTTAAARNIISAYDTDVEIDDCGNNLLEGNYIGTDATGTKALNWPGYPNGTGVSLGYDNGNVIGGSTPGSGNLIAGNATGVSIGAGTSCIVEGNLIGTDYTGLNPLPNGTGILSYAGETNDLIAGNTIAYNQGAGIIVGNYNPSTPSTGDQIKGNSIYANAGPGIDLGGSGVPVLNDSQGHVGPNHFQNYPMITAASSAGSNVTISGTLNSTPNDTFRLEFFSNTAPDPSGYGQGQTFLGSAQVTNGSFTVTLPTPVLAGQNYLTATATDVTSGAIGYGDTSEFSPDFTIPAANQAPVTSQNLQALLAAVAPAGGATTVFLAATTPDQAHAIIAAANGLNPATTPVSNLVVDLGGQTIQDTIAAVPPQLTVTFTNGTFIGGSPALIVQSGQIVVQNSTFSNATDAPTILVTGGSMTLRNDLIQESTGFTDAAISVTGGAVDLGTAADPGGNTINVNGIGTFLRNTTASPIAAVGDTFEINGQATAWPVPLTVTTSSSLMLVGTSPPPLTGFVNGTPFTGSTTYTTAFGDTVTITLGTAATSASSVGKYAITASLSGADAADYFIDLTTSTVGTLYVVSVGADPSSTTGAQAVTFWDNKGNAKLITAAELSSLDALNLVKQGGAAFDPRSVAQLQAWLSVSPNATAPYQLAVQLAAMDLNVLAGYVKATDLVYAGGLLPYATADNISGLTSGGFIDVQDLMNAANAVLAQVSPGAPAHDPNQAYELALAQVLQAANGNSDFVSQELLWSLVGTFV
jgi:hypothetical protein